MAEQSFDRAQGRTAPRGAGLQPVRALRLGGGAVSAALVIGLGVWGYQLAMRQMHGVPVIAAPEGPARTPPADPGGELADHQGLAVNQIAAVGEAGEMTESLLLAPKPADLAPEDTASDALQASLGTPLAAPAQDPAPERTVAPSEAMRATLKRPDQIAEPLPDEAAEPIFDPTEALAEALAMPDPSDLVDATEPGVAQSPRPQPKPGEDVIAAAAAEVVAASLAPGGVLDIDPAALAPGTPLAQIGSYETEAQAKLEWEKVMAQFGPLLEGKNRVIQAAESGGRTFFRLRVAGFESKDDARRFCAALQTGGQCVPALVR